MTQPKYLSPFTDYGFKKVFGEDGAQNSLISFLNDALPIECCSFLQKNLFLCQEHLSYFCNEIEVYFQKNGKEWCDGFIMGYAEGFFKQALDSAERMLEKNFDWDTITEITGITETEYKKHRSR